MDLLSVINVGVDQNPEIFHSVQQNLKVGKEFAGCVLHVVDELLHKRIDEYEWKMNQTYPNVLPYSKSSTYIAIRLVSKLSFL